MCRESSFLRRCKILLEENGTLTLLEGSGPIAFYVDRRLGSRYLVLEYDLF